MLSDFRFTHIGVATTSIERTSDLYLKAGYSLSKAVTDPVQNVRIAFLTKKEMPSIELLEPLDNTSPVSGVLSRSGVAPYHFCYEVDDVELAMEKLEQMNYSPLAPPVEAVAMSGKKICFLYHKDVGLIEIVGK